MVSLKIRVVPSDRNYCNNSCSDICDGDGGAVVGYKIVAGVTTEHRYRMFAAEFFKDCDAHAAYKRAGYKGKSDSVVCSAVAQLFVNTKVQQHLQAEFARLQSRTEIQQDRTMLEVCRLAYSDLRQVASWGPDGVDLHESSELSEDAAASVQDVQSVKKTRTIPQKGKDPITEEEVRTRIKLHPKEPALKMLQEFFRRGDPLSLEAEAKVQALLIIMAQYVDKGRLTAFRAHVLAAFGSDIPGDDGGPQGDYRPPASVASHSNGIDAVGGP